MTPATGRVAGAPPALLERLRASGRGPLNPGRSAGGLLALVALLAVAAAVWAPFGLSATGLAEEWSIYVAYDRGEALLAPDWIVSQQSSRPFLALPFALGYWLSPDSFFGLQLVQLLLSVAKGWMLYVLLRRLLPDLPEIAFFSAVLLLVYPADSGLFNTRFVAMHAAVFFCLLAVYLLRLYWERPGWGRLLAMWTALAFCLGIYEVAYPLFVFIPLLLVWWEGGFTRRVGRVTALWWMVPLVLGLWTVAAVLRPSSYQHHVLLLGQPGAHAFGPYLDSLGRAYVRVFVGGWQDALSWLASDSWLARVGKPIALVAAGVVGVLGWVRLRQDERVPGLRRLVGVLLVGVVVVGLGFLAFVPLPFHRAFNERVFMLPAVGGALAVTALLRLVTRSFPGGRLVFVVAASALVGLATVGALGQQEAVRLASATEQRILADVARAVPAVAPDTVLLILDERRQFAAASVPFELAATPGHFADAVRFLYRDPSLTAAVCHPGPPWGAADQRCELTSSGVTLSRAVGAYATYPLDRLVFLDHRGPGETLVLAQRFLGEDAERARARGYRPEARLRQDRLAPPRAHTLLERWQGISAYDGSQEWVRLEFDKPVPGYGWHAPEGQPAVSLTWMSERSAAELWLRPDRSYRLTCRVLAFELVPGMLQSLTLEVNGRPVELTARPDAPGGVVLEGRIPQDVVALDPRKTLLTFQATRAVTPKSIGMNEDPRLLGVNFDWLQIDSLGAGE